jgi:hypothetical protein
MANPSAYTCQHFTSEKQSSWTPSDPQQPQQEPEINHVPGLEGDHSSLEPSRDDIQLASGHYRYSKPLFWFVKDDTNGKLAERDRPFIEPLVTVTEPQPALQPEPKKVTKQAPRERQVAMSEGNPIRGLFNW